MKAKTQSFDASTITVSNRQRRKKINARFLKRVVAALFEELKIDEAELGIHLVAAKEMARVNWQFLQHEGSTDVITFDHSDSDDASARGVTIRAIHGELFICVDDAVKQSKEFKTTWQSEVVRYLAHGILHLLGYDDLKADLRRAMKREENRLMRMLERRFSLAQLSRAAKIGA